MPLVRCPICGKRFDSDESLNMPFCGERCRRIDLGRWLGEAYSVPVERSEDEGEVGEDYRQEGGERLNEN